MALFHIDDEIFQNKAEWGRNKETFVSAVKKYIEDHYKGEDSEEVYAIFNPQQVNVLKNYFKDFSVEMYKDLCGTVDLQIQQKNEKIKKKIQALSDSLGGLSLTDWVYDGMADGGKDNKVKCDLCPKPVRYAHFAVHKKTGVCLKFGCNCASEFFSVDSPGGLNALHSVQAKSLRDIKQIACVMELNKVEAYYKYFGGSIGKLILEDGVDELKNYMSFQVVWENGKLKTDGDDCFVFYETGNPSKRSIDWVKSHIISCLNADLDSDIYSPLSERKIIHKELTKAEKKEINNTNYILLCMKFLNVDLPLPQNLMDKLNRIISTSTKYHNSNYLKFAQELLISHYLSRSSLLQKVFTDFIVNYYASLAEKEPRDPELAYWGVRGEGTFVNTVLLWESIMKKLFNLKDFYSLTSQGLLTEDEFNRFLKSEAYRGSYYSSDDIKKYMKRCMTLFVSKKEVVKNSDIEVVTQDGYSKYTLKDVDDKISLCIRNRDGTPYKEKDVIVKAKKEFNSPYFTPETITTNIGLHHYAMQKSYANIIKETVDPVLLFLHYLQYLKTKKDIIKYICALNVYQYQDNTIVHSSAGWVSYKYGSMELNFYSEKMFRDTFDRLSVDENFMKEVYSKYKDIIPSFLKDAGVLYNTLMSLRQELSKPIIALPDGKKLTPSTINSDYESLALREEKSNKDCFKEYCALLIGKRGNKKVQNLLYQKNLKGLSVYKQLEKYSDIFEDIQNILIISKFKVEENKLYDNLKLDLFKDDLTSHLNAGSKSNFIKFIAIKHFDSVINHEFTNSFDITTKTRIYALLQNEQKIDSPLKDKKIVDEIDALLPNSVFEACKENKEIFLELLDKFKSLFMYLKSCKGSISYLDFYNLLEVKDSVIEEEMKNYKISYCSSFISSLNYLIKEKSGKVNCDVIYPTSTSKVSGKDKFLDYISYFEGMEDLLKKSRDVVLEAVRKEKEELERIEREKKEEAERLERERKEKGSKIYTLKSYLKEHIDYFEVDVNSARRRNSKYAKSSDASVRKAIAFKIVKYQNSDVEIERFIQELNLIGSDKWSKGVAEIISEYQTGNIKDKNGVKAYAEALRAEMYNQKLIYNHLDLTYNVLKDLNKADLLVLSVEEIDKLTDILKNYYILKSQMDYIVSVLRNHKLLTVDYDKEISNIPEPNITDIKGVLDIYLDRPDNTGYTGLQKAKMIVEHDDFKTLPDYMRGIVSGVIKLNNCTPRQLPHVNNAFKQLGLGNPDSVKVDVANPYVELAKQILAHADKAKAPVLSVKIAETVANSGRCSEKQAKHLDTAKKVLGL